MSHTMCCCLLVPGLVALAAVVPPAAHADEKPVKIVKEWSGSFPNKTDEPLMQVQSADGCITNTKGWTKVWETWRGKEALPDVDFAKHLVVAAAAGGARNTILPRLTLDDKGDFKPNFLATEKGGPGFVYMILIVDRTGIKTCNGKAIAKD